MPEFAMPAVPAPAQAFAPFCSGRCMVAAKTVVPVSFVVNLAAMALVRFHLCALVVPSSLLGGLYSVHPAPPRYDVPGFSQPALQYFETSPAARLSVLVL
jgi:hypothetical protein